MFSGIKSMIFGYADEPANGSSSSSAADSSPASSPGNNEHAPSVLLEQTLNAATTKFTEQLLPQQASIEELQSSSHQLLPSLNEQQKEDELKRDELVVVAAAAQRDETVDDDEINVDSWELLDLIEKKTENNSDDFDAVEQDEVKIAEQEATAQLQQQISKSVGGILKPQEKQQRSKQQQQQTQRQKPKVSFETPDLVKQNKQKHERTDNNNKPKQDKAVVGQSKSKSSKRKSKRTSGKLVLPLEEDVVVVDEDPSLVLFPTSVFPYLAQPSASCSTSSGESAKKQEAGLNYAAVLSATKTKEVEDAKRSIVSTKPNGAVKRNRTVSMSSRSSNDEIDFDDDDNDSIVSSGFSDCDYGYDGLNDYVMRPKKSGHSKRNRGNVGGGEGGDNSGAAAGQSTRNVSLKRGFAKQADKSSAINAKSSIENHKQPKVVKSKKKRVATSAVVSTDFLKHPAPQHRPSSSENNSNDSSDVAEMDESWYVTPPPCFTGSKKQIVDKNQVKAPIVSAQENALIEHPSIYIASTSRATAQAKSEANKSTKKTSTASTLAELAPPAIVLKKITKKPFDEVTEKRSKFDNDDDSWGDSDNEDVRLNLDDDFEKTLSKVNETVGRKASRLRTKSTSQGSSKRPAAADKKAWRNKFAVDDWDLEDPEDVASDFDDMFKPVVRKRKATAGKAKRNKQQIRAAAVREQQKENAQDAVSDDCVSIEMEPVAEGKQEVAGIVEVKQLVDHPAPLGEIKMIDLVPRKPPTPVRPIEPERKPGWQLRRQRSKRRPLATVSGGPNSACTVSPRPASSVGSGKSSNGSSSPLSSSSSSARSTPSLIDRIGSSIVANLTNLTSGLVSSGPNTPLEDSIGLNAQQGQQQNILAQRANKLSIGPNELAARKQMSKGYMKRQNGLNMATNNSNKRPDRRSRMFARPNGCSINRKVQANFH